VGERPSVYNLNTGGSPGVPGLFATATTPQFFHRWTPSLVQETDSSRPFLSRRSITFNSSILTHVFRYDFYHWMSHFFLFASCSSSCTNIFIIRVDRLRTGAWELLGHGLRGLEKSFGALHYHSLCIRTFLVGHWLLRAHFCIWHIEEGWEWRRFPWLICWCCLRWQGYDILSSALVLFP
jgi:hypothetical protein